MSPTYAETIQLPMTSTPGAGNIDEHTISSTRTPRHLLHATSTASLCVTVHLRQLARQSVEDKTGAFVLWYVAPPSTLLFVPRDPAGYCHRVVVKAADRLQEERPSFFFFLMIRPPPRSTLFPPPPLSG